MHNPIPYLRTGVERKQTIVIIKAHATTEYRWDLSRLSRVVSNFTVKIFLIAKKIKLWFPRYYFYAHISKLCYLNVEAVLGVR